MASNRFRSPYNRLLALWVLRAFSPGLGRSVFLDASGYADPDIAMFLGFPQNPDADTLASVPRLLDRLQDSLQRSGAACLPARARGNFAKLAVALKLNPTEERVLEFFACLQVESPLVDSWRLMHKSRDFELSRYVSRILGLAQSAVSVALSARGSLTKCGLLKSPDHPLICDRLMFHSPALARQLLRDSYDSGALLKSFGMMTTPEPKLGLEDFGHLQASQELLLPYLKKVRSARRHGVNFLLHGPPGTGKTQLVRVLGRTLGIPVFELDTADGDGAPRSPQCRLAALNLAQAYFQNTSALLVFDEAEDVLTPSPRDRGALNAHKGWFNQMLEKNHQPMFWISNSIDSLDPAFARRFDFILEVPIPPKSQRERILNNQIGGLVTPGLIDHLAGMEHLAPAVITRARDVIQVISRELPTEKRDAAFTQVIGGILKAQGHADPSKATIQVIQPGLYDVAHLNTAADLPQIAANLRRNPSARLCLYGPPGTGKTSFGHWLAREIGQPLLLQKASDLLSPYLGVTEQKIARAFETAKQDGAVLLIDEVDSFLQDRTQTRHSWEVTQINEMLTQIESFPGILIASTNLIDQLDPASMRRFDIKLHFGYLLPDQASRLLVSYCRNLKLKPPTAADLDLAESLEAATPGDFAAVARQHRFQPFRDAGGLLQAVSAESDLKAGRSRRIGFQ